MTGFIFLASIFISIILFVIGAVCFIKIAIRDKDNEYVYAISLVCASCHISLAMFVSSYIISNAIGFIFN